jgi:hypothetical protein
MELAVHPPWYFFRARLVALLSGWLDKNLRYPITEYLPLSAGHTYTPLNSYGDISGGKAWEAAQQFRNLGISAERVQRLQQWGFAFTDRAARIQYGH